MEPSLVAAALIIESESPDHMLRLPGKTYLHVEKDNESMTFSRRHPQILGAAVFALLLTVYKLWKTAREHVLICASARVEIKSGVGCRVTFWVAEWRLHIPGGRGNPNALALE